MGVLLPCLAFNLKGIELLCSVAAGPNQLGKKIFISDNKIIIIIIIITFIVTAPDTAPIMVIHMIFASSFVDYIIFLNF